MVGGNQHLASHLKATNEALWPSCRLLHRVGILNVEASCGPEYVEVVRPVAGQSVRPDLSGRTEPSHEEVEEVHICLAKPLQDLRCRQNHFVHAFVHDTTTTTTVQVEERCSPRSDLMVDITGHSNTVKVDQNTGLFADRMDCSPATTAATPGRAPIPRITHTTTRWRMEQNTAAEHRTIKTECVWSKGSHKNITFLKKKKLMINLI